jgi:hypothetical protein
MCFPNVSVGVLAPANKIVLFTQLRSICGGQTSLQRGRPAAGWLIMQAGQLFYLESALQRLLTV